MLDRLLFCPFDMAGQHRAAADKYGGDIQPGCRHQQAGHILITVGNHNQSVELRAPAP